MNANELGHKLADLLRANDMATIYGELYSPDILSVEAHGEMREYRGMEAINGKNEWWESTHEVHSFEFEGPFPHGDDQFAMIYTMDVTDRPSGNRFTMREVGVYRVDGGKIAEERFFYAAD